VVIGNRGLMQSLGIDTESVEAEASAWRGRGDTVIFVALDGHLSGAVAVGDAIKATASGAPQALKEERLRSSC
jgi:P-type Cu+ transporter